MVVVCVCLLVRLMLSLWKLRRDDTMTSAAISFDDVEVSFAME